MAWTYNQSNGTLSHDGSEVAQGYSGFGAARNNPAMQAQVNLGPIPRGAYEIGSIFDSETHGPVCLHLIADEDTETFGRGGFLIHGDSMEHPGLASHGCIILPRPIRLQIGLSNDRLLQVV